MGDALSATRRTKLTYHLEVLAVHPRYQVFLVVGQALVSVPHTVRVSPAAHGVEGEPERLGDRHGWHVPIGLTTGQVSNRGQ